ncbi:hypothetical protein OIU78_012290 [Salix suchowensis]|nr:hypothetical protein OIU78_012290 [Salix suchowensis]
MESERVQNIASTFEDTIPEAFVRSEQEQPAITTVHGIDLDVPVIDVSDPDEEKINRLIADASREWGMFQIVNHGIPSEVISKFQGVGRAFFELPQEEKELYAKPPGGKRGGQNLCWSPPSPDPQPSALQYLFFPEPLSNSPDYFMICDLRGRISFDCLL